MPSISLWPYLTMWIPIVLDGPVDYNRDMIGNETDAARALTGTPFASGSFRAAHLINGIVYKVGLRDNDFPNESEFAIANKHRDNMRDGFVIPDMTLYKVKGRTVLAMPFIEGTPTGDCVSGEVGLPCDCEHPCMPNHVSEYVSTISFDSVSWGNTILHNGIYYLIDVDVD